MVVAMMPPLLAQPLTHVWTSSLPERRPWALLLFSTGYLLVWLTAGLPLIAAGTVLRLASPTMAVLPAVVLVALLWSASPWCQFGRNRCHRIHRIGAFGLRADGDCVTYGVRAGSACTVVCWPWMLSAICIHDGHSVAMASATILLFLDRLAPSTVPAWRVPPVLRLARRMTRPPQKVLGRP